MFSLNSYYNQVKVLAFLIIKDADVNCKNFAGDTPMHLAAIKTFEWAVMMLIKAGGTVALHAGHAPRRSLQVLRSHLTFSSRDDRLMVYMCILGGI